MSLTFFHKVFIAAAFLCLAFTARWASGHNAAGLATPWLEYFSFFGMAVLMLYLLWRIAKS